MKDWHTFSEGVKFDDAKTDWDLIPFDALEAVTRVLMEGANTYGRENWRLVPNAHRRYWNAAMRHMVAYRDNETDPQYGESHLAHAMCCMLFLLALDIENDDA